MTGKSRNKDLDLKNYEIYLGYACNRSCRFCFVEKEDRKAFLQPPPFDEISRNIYIAAKKGFRSLVFLGGEPTVYPRLRELVGIAKKIGYKRILIFSNGLKFKDHDYAEQLVEAGLDGVTLNIPSHRETVCDFLTRHPGGFPTLLQALDNLRRLKVPVSAICVVNKYNYRDLADYAAFYSSLDIKLFVLQYMKFQGNINPFTQPDNPDINDLKVKMSDCVPYIREMIKHNLKRGLPPPFLDYFTLCVLGDLGSRLIEFNLDVKKDRSNHCWHPDIRNAVTYDVAYSGRSKLTRCAPCVYRDKCRGIEKNYVKVFGSSEFGPVKKAVPAFYSGLKKREIVLSRVPFSLAMREYSAGLKNKK